MQVRCEKCESNFEIDERKLVLTKTDAQGRYKLRCAFCKEVFFVKANAPKPATLPGGGMDAMEMNPEMMGTMVLTLGNKPKAPMKPPTPPPPKEDEVCDVKTSSAHLKRVIITPQRKADLFRQSRWAALIPWDDMKLIAPYWELFRAVETTTVFKQDERNSFMALIVKGKVTLAEMKDGKEVKELGVLPMGKSFGELSLFDAKPRTCQATAEKETFLLILTRKRVELLAKEHPKLWWPLMQKIVGLMALRIREKGGAASEFLMQ